MIYFEAEGLFENKIIDFLPKKNKSNFHSHLNKLSMFMSTFCSLFYEKVLKADSNNNLQLNLK